MRRKKGKQNSSGRWVVGIHAVNEVLRVHPESISQAWVKKNWTSNSAIQKIMEQNPAKNISWRTVEEGQLNKIAQSNQGLAVYLESQPEVDWDEICALDRATVMILDGLEDPHNLGAILRTAWLMGVAAIVLPQHHSVGLTPTAAKVASGGAEHVPVVVESHLPGLIEHLKEAGFWVYGLAHESAEPINSVEFPEKVVWMVGSEDKGLRKTTAQLCDQLVAISQASAGASYNASVAAAIALFETHRQQQSL